MQEQIFSVHDESQQLLFGERLAKCLDDKGCVIFLQGNLGAGKTTLARGFLKGFGYVGKVKSPTYTLIEPYEFMKKTVLHIDLYRIKDPREVEALGLRDYSAASTIFLIEWPENIKESKEWLPSPDVTCYISPSENEDEGRKITLSAQTDQGVEIVQVMVAAWG